MHLRGEPYFATGTAEERAAFTESSQTTACGERLGGGALDSRPPADLRLFENPADWGTRSSLFVRRCVACVGRL